MQHQIISADDFVVLKLTGEVNVSDWRSSFASAAEYFSGGRHRLLVDGTELNSFDVTHGECQKLARNFATFAERGAFYASDPLIYGMVRVIHSYSNNDDFAVLKNRAEAIEFLRGLRPAARADSGLSLPG